MQMGFSSPKAQKMRWFAKNAILRNAGSLSYIIELGPQRIRFPIAKSKAPMMKLMMKTKSFLKSDMNFWNLTSVSGNVFSSMMLSSPSSISHVQRYDF